MAALTEFSNTMRNSATQKCLQYQLHIPEVPEVHYIEIPGVPITPQPVLGHQIHQKINISGPRVTQPILRRRKSHGGGMCFVLLL